MALNTNWHKIVLQFFLILPTAVLFYVMNIVKGNVPWLYDSIIMEMML